MEGPMSWKRLLPLTAVVAIYLCLGAVVFSLIEGKPELERREDLKNLIHRFMDNHTCVDRDVLYNLIESIASETDLALGTIQNKSVSTRWDFTGSFSFVVTVATTIGYGNMSPDTEIGKLVVIAYALIGIPLMFLMLQGLGQHLTVLSNKVNNLKFCSKRPEFNKYLNMVLIILIGVSLLFVGPTFLFMNVEGWTMMDSIYYCFVTLSTIGFGDFIPALSENKFSGEDAGPIYRITAYVWILFGLAYVALIISYISSVLVKKAEKVEQLSRAKLETELKTIQKELTKRKTDIFSLASNVKDSVALGIDGVRKSVDRNGSSLNMNTTGNGSNVNNATNNTDMLSPEIIVIEPPTARSTPNSPFKHKKVKEEPVQLLSFKRRDST